MPETDDDTASFFAPEARRVASSLRKLEDQTATDVIPKPPDLR